ncbi:MAG TPA: hypothetical protein VF039_07175 [Longimicrobiales bacterium]
MKRRKLASRIRSWWQGRGTEACSSCGLSYHYEMEYRCTECDRGICAVCAVRERESVLCPECV